MSEAPAPGRQSQIDAIIGIVLFAVFAALFWNIISLPRTALDQRESLRHLHDGLGVIVFLLAGWRLLRMASGPGLVPPEGLPAASFAFSRAVLACLLFTFALEGLIGLVYGWGEFEREVAPFGLGVPQLMADSDATRKFFGYMHSAFGFYYLFLLTIWVFHGAYQQLRYGAGWLRLLPGTRV